MSDITESQNHRMFGVGRDLCGSSSPTPLPKQGHLQQAAQDILDRTRSMLLVWVRRHSCLHCDPSWLFFLNHHKKKEISNSLL